MGDQWPLTHEKLQVAQQLVQEQLDNGIFHHLIHHGTLQFLLLKINQESGD